MLDDVRFRIGGSWLMRNMIRTNNTTVPGWKMLD
jgi:hypothetical protein